MPIKVADFEGQGSVANVAAGIDYAIANGARVINLSLGTRLDSQALKDAVNRAIAANIAVVAAAGNDALHQVVFPAAYPGVIAVTPLGETDELAFAGALGPEVSVGAPGEQIVTTFPGGVYGFVRGSSAAAAFTSGVAALVLSKDPTITGDGVGRILRSSQAPIASLAGLEFIYRFGRLDARWAVERASAGYADLAVRQVRVYPARPRPGQASTVVVEVENKGNVAWSPQVYGPSGTSNSVTLAPGARLETTFAWTAPATAGTVNVTASIDVMPGETLTADNTLTVPVAVDPAGLPDLRVVDRSIALDPVAGTATLSMTVENRGADPATNVVVQAIVDGTPLPAQTIPTLAVGAVSTNTFAWTAPTPAPKRALTFAASAQPLPGETSIDDNTAFLDFVIDPTATLRGLYQQSSGVDIIPDAPWRVAPNRDYVPVQVWVPSHGGTFLGTSKLKIDHGSMIVRDDPASTNGTTVYDQSFGAAPTTAPSSLVIVDENGAPTSGTHAQELFGSQELTTNGHHQIYRMPRTEFSVPAAPSPSVRKFLDVKLDWTYSERLFWIFTITRSGSHRSVLKIDFAEGELPLLPGESRYYDVHHHTIAEWYFSNPLDIFCPRKAYGGPIQMVMESAWAMGVTPAVPDVKDRIICTDHNCFYNMTGQDPDNPDHRPPYGPTSITVQPGTTKKQAYETIFGLTSGEEVAIKQDTPNPVFSLPNIPVLNMLNAIIPGLPIGAHMLVMRAEHVEGPWHGGGILKGPAPNQDVLAFPLMNQFAKTNPTVNGNAFIYLAHPYSGQGWNQGNLDHAFGLQTSLRTRDEVNDTTNEFLVKGLEFMNGRTTRSLDTSKIDFQNLNPWADPQFAAGSSDWDLGWQNGLVIWQKTIATDLSYAFTTDPDTKFIRKVFIAAGSDAHGDFNFAPSRLATPISIQSTFSVGDDAWYKPVTYCFSEGKPGATPGERALQAYCDGSTVCTDGPLLTFALDADSKFDAANLKWHGGTKTYENDDGRIGGGGAFDGLGTALVRRGSTDVAYKYRYTNTPDFGSNGGQIVALKLYKSEPGAPNPTRARGSNQQLVARASLPTTAPDKDLFRDLDPQGEGVFQQPTAISLAAFTGGDPDQTNLAPDEHRAYTNPVYVIPFDGVASIGRVDSAAGVIPKGQLTITFTFDVSMKPDPITVEIKALDANGASTDKTQAPLQTLVPASGTGWLSIPGTKSCMLALTNGAEIPINGAAYPSATRTSFVVYTKDAPKDAWGNALNPIAVSFDAPLMAGTPGSTTNPGGAPGSTHPGSTNPGATSPGGSSVPGTTGGGHGGSGCAIAASEGRPTGLAPLALAAVVLALVRRRARRAV
jgi:hypothetical protein